MLKEKTKLFCTPIEFFWKFMPQKVSAPTKEKNFNANYAQKFVKLADNKQTYVP